MTWTARRRAQASVRAHRRWDRLSDWAKRCHAVKSAAAWRAKDPERAAEVDQRRAAEKRAELLEVDALRHP